MGIIAEEEMESPGETAPCWIIKRSLIQIDRNHEKTQSQSFACVQRVDVKCMRVREDVRI